MTPSKLLMAGYMIGGCAVGSVVDSAVNNKKPGAASTEWGIFAFAGFLAVCLVVMFFRSKKRAAEEGSLGWWALYMNPVTAVVCFVAGFLLIAVGLF